MVENAKSIRLCVCFVHTLLSLARIKASRTKTLVKSDGSSTSDEFDASNPPHR